MLCKHDWEILSETVTKSNLQHTKDLGYHLKKLSSFDLKRKQIQIVTCKKCGKLKRFVEEI